MLNLSEILLQHKEVTTFDELVDVVKQRARNERFFRMDLKPPFFDTPENWEWVLEAAFSGHIDGGDGGDNDETGPGNESLPSNEPGST